MPVHGGKLAARALKNAGVEVLFTLPGGHIMPLYQGCLDEGIRIIDVRHEQAAVHAADTAGGEDPNAGQIGADHRRGDGGGTNSASRQHRRQVQLAITQYGVARTLLDDRKEDRLRVARHLGHEHGGGAHGGEVRDATALVNWQRAVKSPAEIGYMRRAARIVEQVEKHHGAAAGARAGDGRAATSARAGRQQDEEPGVRKLDHGRATGAR